MFVKVSGCGDVGVKVWGGGVFVGVGLGVVRGDVGVRWVRGCGG